MTYLKTSLAAAACLIPLMAQASGEHAEAGVIPVGDAGFTYEMFEAGVPHVDLADCPGDYATQEVFCRLTLAEGMMNVFVFSLEGAQPLLAIQTMDPGLPDQSH